MITRLQPHLPPTASPAVSRLPSARLEPVPYRDWLQTLKRQHLVRVLTHTGEVMPPAMVTNETPCYVFVGKLKFRRSDGWQVARNAASCYRMRLRLVRNEKEFT